MAWPEIGNISLLAFVGFVPLLMLEHQISASGESKSRLKIWGYAYLSFLTWNLLTTWWIYFASLGGMLMANFANALLMSIPFVFYQITKEKIGLKRGLIGLCCYWIAFEYLHLDWDLTWPWLTLGNVFANNTAWIQWYEYTGVFGGSLWVLMLNSIVFSFVIDLGKNPPNNAYKWKYGISIVLIILLPIFISNIVKSAYQFPEEKIQVVILQPNIDPYAKFSEISPKEQMENIISLAKSAIDKNTAYLIGPETSMPRNLLMDEFENSPEYADLIDLIDSFPQLQIVTGGSIIEVYNTQNDKSATARYSKREDLWYDVYNSAIQINAKDVQFYHKSKLVPGVEKMPFPAVFKHLEGFAIDLGGTTGSLGMQKERTSFFNTDSSLGIAPVICYESIYGEFVGDYLNKGANAIFIITNDGWWEDTPGYQQHLAYAKLRAIEHRKSIARSANTGISCSINPKGEIINPSNWWEMAVLKEEIHIDRTRTFYSRFGDYLGRIAALISPLLILSVFVKRKK